MNQIKLIIIIFLSLSEPKFIFSASTSLIIPCHYKHAKFLDELLKAYEHQTSLPNEVVISLSEANLVEQNVINSLKVTQWLFPVRLLLSNNKMNAAQNRNIACRQAAGEIFILQDADDLPHPQRIEIIKYFFDKFNLDFLLHKFVYNNETEMKQLKTIDNIDSIACSYIKTYHEAWVVGYMLFGQPAIHKSVFQKVQWPNIAIGEDNTFDSAVIRGFKKCMMIHCPLYIYRFENSVTEYNLHKKRSMIQTHRLNKPLYKVEILYI